MLDSLLGYARARAHLARRQGGRFTDGRFRGTASERGQGTVEYVGLILLVSLLMVGMVAAMKGFNKSFRKGRDPSRRNRSAARVPTALRSRPAGVPSYCPRCQVAR